MHLQLSHGNAAVRGLKLATKTAFISRQLLPCIQTAPCLRAWQGSVLTGQLLCRSRAEDLRAQLLEFQAPREESRPQMVDWLKSSAGEAKQVGVWWSESPAAAFCAPEEPLSASSLYAQQCALEQLSMCLRGALEWVLMCQQGCSHTSCCVPSELHPAWLLCANTKCPGSGLHAPQWV